MVICGLNEMRILSLLAIFSLAPLIGSSQNQIITRDADTMDCVSLNIELPFLMFKERESPNIKRIPLSHVHKYRYSNEWNTVNNFSPEYYFANTRVDSIVDQQLLLGQKFRGGYIFYLDESGQHGLIAASIDQGTQVAWGCEHKKIDASNLTFGLSNTKLIIEHCGFKTAALLCAEFDAEGYSDWYLPSIDELDLLYQGRKYVPEIGAGDYCSSSEYAKGNNDCWAIHFAKEGERFRYNKGFKYRVRAIRRF
jgi:hypothetical protein